MKKLFALLLLLSFLLFATSAYASGGETVCTPVYGMANTCAEHAVVDTALDTSIFYNLAGLSYFTGLAAFIRAKKRA